jgi:TRAP-type C4-dicarboxylate transport system permease small subunit
MSNDADKGRRALRHAPGGVASRFTPLARSAENFRQGLEIITRALAFFGGALLVMAIVITLVSVIGRYGFGQPVPGDYELIEITCAIGVFLFFPYTHAVNGNISAEFFTAGLSARWQRILDTGNEVIFTAVAMLLTWRLSHGLMDKFATGETTILIRIPMWWAYSVAVLAMFLLTIVCLMRVIAGPEAERQ